MYNLTYKSIDVMKKSKDTLTAQLSTAEKQALVSCLASLGITHIAMSVPLDANSVITGAGTTPSPNTIEGEVQDWCDVIHAQQNVYGSSVYGGYLKVIHRGTFSGVENIWSVPYDRNTPGGTAASSSTDGATTWCGRFYNYLYNSVGNHVATGDIFAPIPEGTTNAFPTSHSNTVTMTIASPCVVTQTAHGLLTGTAISFTTSILLPTGVVSGTTYYLSKKDANSYYLFDTQAHAIADNGAGTGTGIVNSSGAQAGTQTSTYSDWFIATQSAYLALFPEFHTMVTTYAAAKSKTLVFMSHNNFSEVATGYLSSGLFSDQSLVGADYYGQRRGSTFVEARDYVYDWQQLYAGHDPNGGGGNGAGGINQFWGEWGDLASAVPSGVEGSTLTWTNFLNDFYRGIKENLVAPYGPLIGFNYWGGWEGQDTSIVDKTGSGSSSVYTPNFRGLILKKYYSNPQVDYAENVGRNFIKSGSNFSN